MNLNIYAPITTQTSYGNVSRNIISNLMRLGHQVWTHNIHPNHISIAEDEQDTVGKSLQEAAFYDPKAPCLKIFHADQLKSGIGSGKKVSFPIYELDSFNDDEIQQLLRQDALIVTSQWAKSIMDNAGISDKVPVHICPPGVNRDIFHEGLIPKENDIAKDDATKFLCVGKFELRKGHDIVLEAFDIAFRPTDNVGLIMSCRNNFISDQRNDEWALYYKTGKLSQKVFVLDRYLESQRNVANLMASVDCGVCVSRTEGWDMPAHEFLSMGKHVIATNVTAHTEFLDKNNAMLVDCPDMEPASDGVFFNGRANWFKIGQQQVEEIAAYMRLVHELKQSGQLGVNLSGVETAKKYSWSETARKCVEALI